MSTVIEPDAHSNDPESHIHSGNPDEQHVPGADQPNSYYIWVAIVLAVVTAAETSTYWIDFGPAFMPVLMVLMAFKFFTVVRLFMHLKFDNKIFSLLFYSGLALAVFVYLGALLTFRVFDRP